MISEKTFSKGYSSFWLQNTPWLTEYITFINKGAIERKFKPINSNDETVHRSVNNTASFLNFKLKFLGQETSLEKVIESTSNYLGHFPQNGLETYILDRKNKIIIVEQTSRLLSIYKEKQLIFEPKFSGCGIVSNCQGDFLYGTTITEIKAGERNIQSADIRQLLIYCALNWLSEVNINIENIEIFNPRQGIYWVSNLRELLNNISTLTMEDFFEEIGNFMYTASEEIEN